jgi:hypothetical protein
MRGNRQVKPFAVELLKEYRNGKSVEELSHETGIPAERIDIRLRAAAEFLTRTSGRARMSVGGRQREPGA